MGERRVYGPVPSRRFGLSLGVDLVPRKVCPYDCIYCQLGPTTECTLERREFYPPEAVLADVARALQSGPRPDVLTLAGSGEPSLYRPLGELIDGLHRLSEVPVLLLTNGALFFQPEVAKAALRADWLAPSLDAGLPATFTRVNQPHPDMEFERMLESLQAVCAQHPGPVHLEVMLIAGVNDGEADLAALGSALADIRTDTIDVNTPVRPIAGRRIVPCELDQLERVAVSFGPRARVVGGYRRPAAEATVDDAERALLETIARRPCCAADLVSSLGLKRERVDAILKAGITDRRIEVRAGPGGEPYFFAIE